MEFKINDIVLFKPESPKYRFGRYKVIKINNSLSDEEDFKYTKVYTVLYYDDSSDEGIFKKITVSSDDLMPEDYKSKIRTLLEKFINWHYPDNI